MKHSWDEAAKKPHITPEKDGKQKYFACLKNEHSLKRKTCKKLNPNPKMLLLLLGKS